MRTDNEFVEVIKKHLPGIRSEAQYEAFVLATTTYLSIVDRLLRQEDPKELRAAFDQSLDAVRLATRVTEQLEDSPEAATSKAAEAFKMAPKAYHEEELTERLKMEIQRLDSPEACALWYKRHRSEMDGVTLHRLRNELFDLFRAKQNEFA